MAAFPAPGEAVWLPEAETPHNQANMGLERSVQTRGYRPEATTTFPSVIGAPGSISSNTVLGWMVSFRPTIHPGPPLLQAVVTQFDGQHA
jgi:hypothetical protein